MNQLVKAKIEVYDSEGAVSSCLSCMFNPSEYKIKNTVRYAKKHELGRDYSDYQYVHGESRELSLVLYFDTSGAALMAEETALPERGLTPVTEYTKKITGLCKVKGSLHRPPTIGFSWGGVCFKGALTAAGEEFTLFSVEGVPIRAKLDLTIAETADGASLLSSPPESPDRTKYRIVTDGMSLWKLAYEEYKDAGLWRVIAQSNGLMNPLDLKTGQWLKIPAVKR